MKTNIDRYRARAHRNKGLQHALQVKNLVAFGVYFGHWPDRLMSWERDFESFLRIPGKARKLSDGRQ